MGNAGSHAPGQTGPGVILHAPSPGRQPLHWQHSLPTDPHLKASHLKVLPDLDQNPRLRSTNNGVILQSGGTISGRKPLTMSVSHEGNPNGNISNGVYRSKSITQEEYDERGHHSRFSYFSNQRDPLHRSHTHLHLDDPPDSFITQSKKFGSEPDLRVNGDVQAQPKGKVKNFKKKYKAPPPPQTQGSSSPDSWNSPQFYEHRVPQAPSRKLRLFKTRAETKMINKHNHDVKPNGFVHSNQHQEFVRSYQVEEARYHPNDILEQSRYEEREKLFRSPSRDREEFLKYPGSREEDMIQSHSSLKREEKILQTAFNRQEVLRTKHSQQNMYREKARQAQELKFDSNKEFRNSERFKKPNYDPGALRREKSFDNSLVQEIERNGVNRLHNERKMLLDSQNKFNNRDDSNVDYRYKDKEPSNAAISKRKSVPNMPLSNGVNLSDFQTELMMATKKLRNVTTKSTPNKSESDVKSNPNRPMAKKDTTSKTNTIENKLNRNKNNIKESKITPVESKVNSPRITSAQLKTANMTTLDRSKHIKPNVVKTEKKEDKKVIQKVITPKVLPSSDKLNKESNSRNRRESRVMADRGQASGKESTPEQSPSRVKPEAIKDRNQNGQPSKSFYFGMDKSQVPVTDEELDAHEKVRRHLEMNYNEFVPPVYTEEDDIIHITPKIDYNARLDLPQGSSESALSSEPEPEDLMSEENNPHGIALQLRPTLPKKQLEIPRFSPAAAWRQLASLEIEESFTNIPQPIPNAPVPTEEKIRRQSQVSPNRWGKPERGSHDKSGDSGISGDAGPNHDDCIDGPPHSPVVARREENHKRPLLSAWTPQQDLEEESSSDPGNESPHSGNTDGGPAKFSARQQVFSLSLPRESHVNHLGEKNKQFQQPFNSLQKLKKSVSGAIGVALGSKKVDEPEDTTGNEQTESNWFLSRSAPNSLNNALNTPNPKLSTAKSNDSGQQQTPPSSDQEDDRMPPVVPGMMRQQPPFSYLATGGHVMYLPKYDSQRGSTQNLQESQQPFSMSYGTKDRAKEAEQKSDGEMDEERYKALKDGRLMSRSKSSGEIILSPRNPSSKPRPKGKRFTFQSTVRQIERKRLAEKLSKEAESKERQRLSELEAMRRVEEEFQRKRAREKASIRQQLRLVSLDESCSSLPSSWGRQGRVEPEGAVSPSPPPASRGSGGSGSAGGRRISGENSTSSKGASPSPKVGRSRITNGKSNDYREPREYKDYRRTPSTPVLPPAVHPPACYNMPRVGRTPIGPWETNPDNYRREFARGRRPPSSSGSDLSQGGRLLTPPRLKER